MIIKNNTNQRIEQHKAKLGLTGDVYLVNDHLLESLESHKRMFPESTARSIYEAEQERIEYEAEQARIRQILAEEDRAREEAERAEENEEESEE